MFLLTFLLACTDYAKLCAENDPSVDAATCWRQGRQAGYSAGYGEGYDTGYAEGEADCLADAGWWR